jgi:hypothetical protein
MDDCVNTEKAGTSTKEIKNNNVFDTLPCAKINTHTTYTPISFTTGIAINPFTTDKCNHTQFTFGAKYMTTPFMFRKNNTVFPHIFAIQHYDPPVTHGGIPNTRVGTGFGAVIQKVVKWEEYKVTIGKDIAEGRKVQVIDNNMVEVVQEPSKVVGITESVHGNMDDCADWVTDSSGVTEYEVGRGTSISCSETDGGSTDDAVQPEVNDVKSYQDTAVSSGNDEASRKDISIEENEVIKKSVTRTPRIGFPYGGLVQFHPRHHPKTWRSRAPPLHDTDRRKKRLYQMPMESIPEHPLRNKCLACIPPVMMSATVKAGRRCGANRKRVPICVTDIPVIFIEHVRCYVCDDQQNPVYVVVVSQKKCLFFLPIVRTPQDFAAHAA